MNRFGTWWLPCGDTHIADYLALQSGEYQSQHRRTSLQSCRKRRVAVDVGA